MKKIALFILSCFVLLACERKDEQMYNELIGEWYIFAAYPENGNVDLLPLADVLGYSCIKTSVLEVHDSTFVLHSDCDFLACQGSYVRCDSVIFGSTTDNDSLTFYFNNGVLSTIQEIDVIGRVDMRFQKKENGEN